MAELETKRLRDQMREYLDQNPEFAARNANLWNLGMIENDPTIRYLMREKDFRAAGSPVAPQGYTHPFIREDWAGLWRNTGDLAEIAYRWEEITDPDASGDPRTGTEGTKFHEAGGHSAMDFFQWADESLWNDVTFDDPVSGKAETNKNAFIFDDGNGNLLFQGRKVGSIDYEKGQCQFVVPALPEAEFKEKHKNGKKLPKKPKANISNE